MTVLSTVQTIAKRLILPTPSAAVGSTDNNVTLILALLEQTGKEIRDDFPWPELVKEYTFTLATSTDSYVLPSDFDSTNQLTLWNRDQHWPLIGPTSGEDWQTYKSGLITTLPRQRYRVKGWQSKQFFIDPTPSSSENGQTIAYEYQSKTWIRPKTWVASTSWGGIQYCSYNGNIYDRGGVGVATTGTTPPTHTSGAVSDGSITWTYYSSAYETFIHDTDEVILDEEMLIEGCVWRWKAERGLDYQDLKERAIRQVESQKTKANGVSVVSARRRAGLPPLIGIWSYPEGNYG